MRSVMKCKFGSHLYGTNTPSSDTDFKEVFVPSPEDILYGSYRDVHAFTTGGEGSKNNKDDIDSDSYSLRKFINLLIEGDTFAMDMLHANKENIVSMDYPEVWQYIYNHRSDFYTTNMKSYLGYVRKQAAKYGVKGSRRAALRKVVDVLKNIDNLKHNPIDIGSRIIFRRVEDIKHLLPADEFLVFTKVDIPQKGGEMEFYEVLGRKYQMTITVEEMKKSVYKLWDEYGDRARKAEANHGIDWKALSHAYRAGYQILEIYETGDLIFPLKEATLIKQIKAGLLPFKEVQQLLEELVDKVERLAAEKERDGTLKSFVDPKPWRKFVEDVHLEVIKNYIK